MKIARLLSGGTYRGSIYTVKFRVLLQQDETGGYVATCPTLPGCVSQGESRNEALLNIQDAIAGYLASLKKHDEPVPPPVEEEFVEVSA